MMNELDMAVLTTDLPEHSLKAGDLGTMVLVHTHGGYEVEFMTLDEEIVAVVSLSLDQVRPIGRREIAHARLVTTEWRFSRLVTCDLHAMYYSMGTFLFRCCRGGTRVDGV